MRRNINVDADLSTSGIKKEFRLRRKQGKTKSLDFVTLHNWAVFRNICNMNTSGSAFYKQYISIASKLWKYGEFVIIIID